MIVEYMNHMGNDYTVCDAARVSMDKDASQFCPSENDRLIRYLATHKHWSPFSHAFVTMRFTAPIFIARQLQKHQIGFAWNEVSRRYVSSSPTFWKPHKWRPIAPSVKQGSKDEYHAEHHYWDIRMDAIHSEAVGLYDLMIANGVCPEQARAILPQSTMTEWIWSGSLCAWARMYNLRNDQHAQSEVRQYAQAVAEILAPLYPVSWTALVETQH